LVKEKEKCLKWTSSKDPQDRIEFKRMQGKIRKIITEEKNKSWEKEFLQWKATWVANEAQKHGEY
jgi:hypothetical protein